MDEETGKRVGEIEAACKTRAYTIRNERGSHAGSAQDDAAWLCTIVRAQDEELARLRKRVAELEKPAKWCACCKNTGKIEGRGEYESDARCPRGCIVEL